MRTIIIYTLLLALSNLPVLAGPHCFDWTKGKLLQKAKTMQPAACNCKCMRHRKNEKSQCVNCGHYVLPTRIKIKR